MHAKVTAMGRFYSFISQGLGRELGMAMGFSSVVAYAVFEPSICGGFAYFMNLKIRWSFNVNVPWPVLALAMVAVVVVLTSFDIKVSSAVLGVSLVA